MRFDSSRNTRYVSGFNQIVGKGKFRGDARLRQSAAGAKQEERA
jgi:hypothetical protein